MVQPLRNIDRLGLHIVENNLHSPSPLTGPPPAAAAAAAAAPPLPWPDGVKPLLPTLLLRLEELPLPPVLPKLLPRFDRLLPLPFDSAPAGAGKAPTAPKSL